MNNIVNKLKEELDKPENEELKMQMIAVENVSSGMEGFINTVSTTKEKTKYFNDSIKDFSKSKVNNQQKADKARQGRKKKQKHKKRFK